MEFRLDVCSQHNENRVCYSAPYTLSCCVVNVMSLTLLQGSDMTNDLAQDFEGRAWSFP